jgi:hypothetical protein
VEDKNERISAYYEMLFTKFPKFLCFRFLYQTIWRKSFRILQKNGRGSELQKKYAEQKKVEDLIVLNIKILKTKTNQNDKKYSDRKSAFSGYRNRSASK